jgi:dTDP-4-dehydrorhamnose reductase
MNKTKILILGAGGMLGHVLFQVLSGYDSLDVYGTVRNSEKLCNKFNKDMMKKIINGIDADKFNVIDYCILKLRPEIVLNCIGIIKQLPEAKDPIISIGINSLLPHKITKICGDIGARLIHFSTDCVFDGKKGNYSEMDIPDAADLYGRTKFLGEVTGLNCLTIRTSIIGHELGSHNGLVEWFLSQNGKIEGYRNAIFSGFPTIEIANILTKYIIPNKNIEGLYHLSAKPISKYDLLKLIAEIYKKDIEIIASCRVNENRSLDSSRFHKLFGYIPPEWVELVGMMHDHYINTPCYNRKKA